MRGLFFMSLSCAFSLLFPNLIALTFDGLALPQTRREDDEDEEKEERRGWQ